MLCFEPKSLYIAPGVKLTIQKQKGNGTDDVVFEASQKKAFMLKQPLKANIELDGQFVEYGKPDVPHEEVLEQFELTEAVKGSSAHAANFRFDKSKRFLLKAMIHARYKKPRHLILARGKQNKNCIQCKDEPGRPAAWPSPDACFALTHIHSAQRGCHHDPAWLDLAQEFVPRHGGMTPVVTLQSDVVAIENAMFGLEETDLLDVDVATRKQGPCGLDVKHVDISGNKKLSLTRDKTKTMKGKENVGTQVGLLDRMLRGGGKHKKEEAGKLLLPQVERLSELLSKQQVAMLYDSSILLILGKNKESGELEGRVRLIDFGKEIHNYHWLVPKMIPTRGMTRGQRCAYGCGSRELVKQLRNLANGGKAPKRCLDPCSNKTWKNKSCQPITVPQRLNGYKADA